MTEVTFVSNVGNFAVKAAADVDVSGDEARNLASLGLGAMVGSVGAAMEKIMWKAQGYAKRPEKWTRTDVGYGEQVGKDMQVAASVKLDELAKEKKLPQVLFEVTGEYVSTEGKEMRKMADGVLATLSMAEPDAAIAFGLVYGFAPTDTQETKREKLVRHFNVLRK